jgi:hypothetical protein
MEGPKKKSICLGKCCFESVRQASQPFTECRDPIYDERGNVIEAHEDIWVVQPQPPMMPITMRMVPTMPAGFIAASLQHPAALDQLDNQHNERNNQQEMDESAQGV